MLCAALTLATGAAVTTAGDFAYHNLAVPSTGDPFDAQLVKIDGAWTVTVAAKERVRELGLTELVRWGALRADRAASRVILDDGSMLMADVTRLSEASITVESAVWPATEIDRNCLAGIIFSPPPGTRASDRLVRTILDGRLVRDAVQLHNGDTIFGELTEAPDPAASRSEFFLQRFGVRTRADRTPITVAVDDAVAVSFRDHERAESPGRDRVVWLGFGDGSLLAADAIDADSRTVRLTLACGQQVTRPTDEAWEDVQFVQPIGAGIDYLSDRIALGYQHSPFLELKRPLGIDRNVLGGRLRCAGEVHLKGLGMATTSRVVFDVTEADRRFAAELALDDEAGRLGSAVFRVFLEKEQDGAAAEWHAAYTSEIVRGGDAPRPISIDLTMTKRIALIVDFADHGDRRDYANWLNARFLP